MTGLYSLIAARVENEPGALDQALATLARWEADGLIPVSRAFEWRQIIERAKAGPGMPELIRLLRDENEAALRMKDFGPFAGILSREERRKAFQTCAYDH